MTRQLTITTPEHVAIRLQPAGVGSRFLAVFIDSLMVMGASTLVFVLLRSILPGGVAAAIWVTVSFLLTWGWHVYFETRRNGRTPGKRALSLRVVDARGLPLTIYQSMVRNVARVVDFMPLFYGVGALTALVSATGGRLGDLIAGTLVVRESTPLAGRGDLAAERRHNTLRTPRVQRLIRHRIGLEEREFLLTLCLRSAKLSPEARYDLMEDVAAFYREKLGLEEEPISGENFVRDLTALCYDSGIPKSIRATKVNP